MKTEINIGNKIIGENNPCFIIAEAGSNFNSDINMAKKLIDVAAESGADVVKFQTFKTERIVTRSMPKADYQKTSEEDNQSYHKLLKDLELTKEDHIILKKYCEKKGIIFMSTAHSNEWSVDLLEEINVPAHKIASGDITNFPFLEYIAKKQKPLVLSTGMSNLDEVKEAVDLIKKTGNNDLIVLHCTTSYPCSFQDSNLRAMLTIKNACNVLVGYSDHTPGIEVAVAAVALGAKVIEKHFTLDRNLPGPDHKASLEPNELKEMIKAIRNVEQALGSGEKKPVKIEEEITKTIRKSIIARKDIKKGTKVTREMLEVKRPGTGLHSKYLNKIIGKTAKVDIKEDTLVSLDQFT